MTTQNTNPKRDKKKLIFLLLIPLLIIFVGFTIFKDMFISDKKVNDKNEKLNAGTPAVKNGFVDSLSKTELYSNLEDEKKRAQEGKAVFDQMGNISTDMKSQNLEGNSQQDNLQARLKNEVAQPIYDDPPVPKFVNTRRNDYSEGDGTEMTGNSTSSKDNGFNSIVLPDGNKKDENTGSYGFYGSETGIKNNEVSVLAETAETQKVMNGGNIKMVLKETLKINGLTIPAGNSIYGIARFNELRIDVDVRSVNINNKIVYMQLKGFDVRDGMEGLAVKETDAAKMGKNAFNEELAQIDAGIGSRVPGYGGQIAGTILRTFSRNKREKKASISIPGGYKIILRN
jgi:hypothetical protein